jgi:hypothetical protein
MSLSLTRDFFGGNPSLDYSGANLFPESSRRELKQYPSAHKLSDSLRRCNVHCTHLPDSAARPRAVWI